MRELELGTLAPSESRNTLYLGQYDIRVRARARDSFNYLTLPTLTRRKVN